MADAERTKRVREATGMTWLESKNYVATNPVEADEIIAAQEKEGDCAPDAAPLSNARRVKALREATGLGWLQAKKFLEENPQTLSERIIAAGKTQTGKPYLYDPIADDPALARQFEAARAKAEAAYDAWLAERNAEYRRQGFDHMVTERVMGGCHFVWNEMKKILREENGIEWFSPREMNPGTVFD
jgi:ribosomal protein L7/L12